MNTFEWFRRTTWTDEDREEFNIKLKRSRGSGKKAQYLRIQAFHLAQAGLHPAAIELLDRLFAEFPEKIELAQAHAQKAASLALIGRTDEAIQEYLSTLQIERDFPNVRTNAWLDLGWIVVERQIREFYDEVSRVVQEFRQKGGFKIPGIEYRYAAIQAFLADARGDNTIAREFALQALAEAAKVDSGLRHHPTVGLVGPERETFNERLKALV